MRLLRLISGHAPWARTGVLKMESRHLIECVAEREVRAAVHDVRTQPEMLDPLLHLLRPGFTDGMRRGVVSPWSKYYFARLIPSAAVASVALDWRLPLEVDAVEVVHNEAGKAVTFKLEHAGPPLSHSR